MLNKHIPVNLPSGIGSATIDLLAGLLDTDGTVSKDGAIQFTDNKSAACGDVQELVVR